MSELHRLMIKCQPVIDKKYTFLSCNVEIRIENDSFSVGTPVASMFQEIVWVPGCVLTASGLSAQDDKGPLELQQNVEKDPQTGFPKKVWRVSRQTEGDVVFTYEFLPRDMTGVTRCHPLFDTIAEENGALIPGITSLLIMPMEKYDISVIWDFSKAPEGVSVVTLRGNGDIHFTGTPLEYLYNYYMVGRVHCAEMENGRYGVYWLNDKLPDEEAVKEQIPGLLKEISRFFRAEKISFRIFFRKEPFDISNSGTAFPGGFAYGYSDAMPLNMDKALNVLAHEMIHNWTTMDHKNGAGAWYNEGMAEYYSLMIPLWSGIVPAKRVAEWLTEKSVNYYNNPFQTMTLEEANKKAWEDSKNVVLQRVPYGRGMFYLADIDLQLQKKYEGKKRLHDVLFPLIERSQGRKMLTNQDWEEAIENELGPGAVTKFREMLNGAYMAPNTEWFDGRFTFTRGAFSDMKAGSFEDALLWRE